MPIDIVRKDLLWIALALLAGIAFTALDLLTDDEPSTVLSVISDTLERTLMMIGVCGLVVMGRRMHVQHQERMTLMRELEIARVDGAQWRTRVEQQVAGVAAEIDAQFQAWDFTEAECQVGRLLLKGLSHKEIGALRGTVEATVRQQTRSLYQKSGLPGKAAFAAYFLEDLLPEESLRSPPATSAEPLQRLDALESGGNSPRSGA